MIWFTAVLLCALALVPIIYLIVSRRRDLSAQQAAQYERSARLPFGTGENYVRVRERLRRRGRAAMWGVLTVLIVGSPVILWGASWGSPLFLWLISLSIVIGVLTISSVAETIRDQLRAPRTDAPRVAHSRQLTARDYLQPWRCFLAPIALGAATAGVAAVLAWWIAQPGRIRTDVALWCAGSLVFAIIVFVVMRVMERVVLSRAQVASDDLQLAWDDLFRADALWTLRSAATMAAALPLGMATGALMLAPIAVTSPDLTTIMSPCTVLIAAAQVIYSLGLGRMAASRYPEAFRPQRRRFTPPRVAVPQGDGA